MTRISHVSLPLFFMVPRRRKINKNRDHTTSKVYRQARYKIDKKKKYRFTDSSLNMHTGKCIQFGPQESESVQTFHSDLSRAILVSIITNINQLHLSALVSELLQALLSKIYKLLL